MAVTKLKKESSWQEVGPTVDDLWRTRRRRVAIRPQSSLKPLEGAFTGLKTEYRRRYRRNSAYLHILEEAVRRGRIRPKDLLESDGERAFSPEYRHYFVPHHVSAKGKVLRRRYTTLKPEGELVFTTESSEYAGKPGDRAELRRRKTDLKQEGVIEFLTEYGVFKGEQSQRPKLTRTPTNLKTEGEFEFSTEYDQFKGEQGERTRTLERRPTNLKLEGDHDLTTEKSDKYKGEKGEKRALERRDTTLKPEKEEEGMKRISETKEQYKIPGHPERADIVIQEGTLHPEGTREFRPKYNEEFIAKESLRPTFPHPTDQIENCGAAKGQSETKSEYKEYQATRPTVRRHPDNLKPEGGVLENSSEVKTQYREIHPTRPVIQRTNSNLKPEGDFERTTEKKAEYRDFHPTRPTIHRTHSNLKPEGDFERNTEKRLEYRDFHPSRPIIYRTHSNLKPEKGEFVKTTEIRSEYKDYHPQRPIIYRTASQLKPEGGFERSTEIGSEYRDFHPCRPTIHRTKSNLKPEGDFANSTEVRSEYKDYQPGRPKIYRVNSHLKPEGGFDGATESGFEYRDFHPGRPVLCRNNSLLKPEGNFLRDTENKCEYRDFHPERPVICRVNSELRPEGDFCLGGSEFRSEYREQRPSRPVVLRPGSQLRPEGERYGFHDQGPNYPEYPAQRPVIYEHATHILPGVEVAEGKALRPKIRYEGEIQIREERGRTAPPTAADDRKVSFAPKHRRYGREEQVQEQTGQHGLQHLYRLGGMQRYGGGEPSLQAPGRARLPGQGFRRTRPEQQFTVFREQMVARQPPRQKRALDAILVPEPKHEGGPDVARKTKGPMYGHSRRHAWEPDRTVQQRPKAAKKRKDEVQDGFWTWLLPIFGMTANKKAALKQDYNYFPKIRNTNNHCRMNY